MHNGLSYQEVEYRKSNGLVNNEDVKYTKTTKQIVLSNVITLFNIINVVLLVLVLTTGSLQNSLFIFIIVANTLIAIYQEVKAKKIIDKLTIANQTKIKVRRDGVDILIPKEEIVLDDLMVLKAGDEVVVDAVIVKSSMCEVDESIITGESDPIIKRKDDSLISGAIIVSGSCLAKVVSIGSKNYASKLMKEASRYKDDDSYLKECVNKILKIVTYAIVPTGIFLFVSQYFYSGQTYKEAILSTVAGIIGMIPEGLVLLTSVALTVGVIKMAKKKVIIQKLSGIEMLSCVDILCLDKTGTITDGSLEVIDVISLNDEDINNIIPNMLPEVLTNATDIALNKHFQIETKYKVKGRIPFSSARKYNAVSFENKGTYALGAIEYITGETIDKYDRYIKRYLDNGYRIITLAHSKVLFTNGLPKDMKTIGFIILKDNIRANAKETIDYFKEQEVNVKIISGDNPVTVSNLLKQISFEGADKYIEGSSLPEDYLELVKVVNDYNIYGRCTPNDKKRIIQALKENSKVGMIGDGVNDILALKEADCGIALASGISAAQSVSEVVLTNSDFNVLPSIVLEGRRVVNNIERVASMYLVKTTYSFILSLMSIILTHEYPFYPIQLSLIGAICVGVPSFFLALEPNYDKVKPGFIRKVFRNALPSGLCVFINILFIIIITELFKINFDDCRLIIVVGTGFINLRLLYSVSKPLNFMRQALLVGCSLVFIEVLILLPDMFFVTSFSIPNIIAIALIILADIYIIDFLEIVYDKIFKIKRNKEGKMIIDEKKQ